MPSRPDENADPGRPDRLGRRKARTRGALLEAAQALLAEGRTSVSIQEITDRADVGFGSFYNHFTSKDELFDSAISETLLAHDAALQVATDGIEDPARLVSVGVRTTGRLQRQAPAMARVLLTQGTALLLGDQGIAARARGDVRRGIAENRFVLMDTELAYMSVGGALLALVQLLDARPDLDASEAADQLARQVLVMLGIPVAEATAIIREPLPEPLSD